MNLLSVRVCCMNDLEKWKSFKTNPTNEIAIIGNQNLEENYVLEDNILYLKCGDYYDQLPEKMIAAFNAILSIEKFNNVTHIIKRDMDTGTEHLSFPKANLSTNYMGDIWHTETINGYWHINMIRYMSPGSPWTNNEYKGPNPKTYCLGGPGYLLSRFAMEKMIEIYDFNNLHEVKDVHIYEDVMVAWLLKSKNITPEQI